MEPALAGGRQGTQFMPQEPVLKLLTQLAPQRCVPLTHVKSHTPPAQTETPLGGGTGHTEQLVPHCAMLSSGTHAPPHRLKPTLHTNAHAPALQVAVAPGGTGHGAQRLPQLAAEASLRHALPHAWNPGSHWKPHALAVHVALAFAGAAGQGAAQPPQFAGSLVVSTHAAPQRSGVAPPQPLEHAPLAHTGVAPEHMRSQTPQSLALPRLASQPLAGRPSQFAKFGSQVDPQATPLQVANALGGAVHGVQLLVPQFPSEVFETHRSPQRW